jgi:hypothetical protein
MTTSHTSVALLALAAVLGAAGCGSGSSGGKSSGGATKTVVITTTVGGGGSGTTTGGTTTQAATKTTNLVVTNVIRGQLLAAGAAMHKLPTTDYTGLRKGLTYYAYDPASSTYWAGAALVPSPSSQQAQIGNQDDGAYLVFKRASGGAWKAWDAGIPGDSHFGCTVRPPASVLRVWDWAPHTCHPRAD